MADIVHIDSSPLTMISLQRDLSNQFVQNLNLEHKLLQDIMRGEQEPYSAARSRYELLKSSIKEPEYVPEHPVISDQVMRPLREAKNCYILGMYVACVSQAGLVGEMVALWRFRMLENQINGKEFDEQLQKHVCGDKFDRLGQQRRIEVLKALDCLSEDVIQCFDKLRELRRKYLHFFVDPLGDVESDARSALGYACVLVSQTLDLQRIGNKFTISDNLKRFLKTAS